MKKKILFLALILLGVLNTIGVSAQKGVDDGSRYGKGQDSIDCVTNYSLFTESAKHKNYADALKPWEQCYENCPMASVNIYIYGAKIVDWQISTAATPADKQNYFNKLMALYDQRIKYFGTSVKHPEGYVLGLKALDYIEYYPNKSADIYEILKKSVSLQGDKSSLPILQYYMKYSIDMFAAKSIAASEVIDNYTKVSNLMPKTDEGKEAQKNIDRAFGASGVADCETLAKIYQAQLDENKQNVEWLGKALSFMARAGCDKKDLYFQIAELKNKIDPTGPSTWALGQKYYSTGNIDKAFEFFENAITQTPDADKKGTYYFQMAQVAYAIKNYAKARGYCYKAVENKPAFGDPYILIAQMYALSASKGELGSKEMQNRAGYWAAYDMAAKAKSVDSSEENVKKASTLMAQYKAQFPSVETVFMDPDYTAGQTKTVGGWINVKTEVRTK